MEKLPVVESIRLLFGICGLLTDVCSGCGTVVVEELFRTLFNDSDVDIFFSAA